MCFASPLSIVLARSLAAAGCSNFSVRPSAPSVPPSLRCSAVRGCARVLPLHRSSIRRLLVIPCVCSLAVSVERPSEGGRERGPCRRCSPSSSLNTAAILLPDQVRSRCSLVCSLGWMERREEGTWNKWSPLDPFSCSSSCSAHQLRLCHCHARWRVVPHPASTVRGSLRLEGLRGAVQERGGTRNFWISTSLVLFPAHARANTEESIARTYYGWSLWLLARNDGHDHGCP